MVKLQIGSSMFYRLSKMLFGREAARRLHAKNGERLSSFDAWTVDRFSRFPKVFFDGVSAKDELDTQVSLSGLLELSESREWVVNGFSWKRNALLCLVERVSFPDDALFKKLMGEDKDEILSVISSIATTWDGKSADKSKNLLLLAWRDAACFCSLVESMSNEACRNAYDEVKDVLPSALSYGANPDAAEEAARVTKSLVKLRASSLGVAKRPARRSI